MYDLLTDDNPTIKEKTLKDLDVGIYLNNFRLLLYLSIVVQISSW